MTIEEAREFIDRAAWRFAKTTADMAPHEYIVLGWDRDDIAEEEFWRFAELVKVQGREERWTPPEEWVRRWGGRPMTNRYFYLDQFAYWFTRTNVAMLNREHVSVQEQTPTRVRLDEQAEYGHFGQRQVYDPSTDL